MKIFRKSIIFIVAVIFLFSIIILNVNANDSSFALSPDNAFVNSVYNDENINAYFDDYVFFLNDESFYINGLVELENPFDDEMSYSEAEELGLEELWNLYSIVVNYSVNYDIEEKCFLLNINIENNDNDVLISDSVPFYVMQNTESYLDAILVFYSDEYPYEYIWLSDIVNEINNVGNEETRSLGSFLNKASKVIANTVNFSITNAVTRAVIKIISPGIKLIVKGVLTICEVTFTPIGAAYIGAAILNMKPMSNNFNLLYADFDCWQQYFGYTDIYDIIFDAGSFMRGDYIEFYDSNGDGLKDYRIWFWKGDYQNLGAGCELGIYKRSKYHDFFWIVDKKMAMSMTLSLKYYGITIIPSWTGGHSDGKSWWITGFNIIHNNVIIFPDALSARIDITFDAYDVSEETHYNHPNYWYKCMIDEFRLEAQLKNYSIGDTWNSATLAY